jgi:hypothetical protein
MDEQAWQPVIEIGEHGTILGVARDGSWVVGHDATSVRPADGAPMTLLPVLERSYQEVDRAIASHVATAGQPPWDHLLHLALTWSSDYWPGRALDWLENGYPPIGLLDTLAWLKDESGRSQPIRHRALRLWKAERRWEV